ncbi:hypothetical protein [Haladaptatus sp. T7]|uniref:hypothetical protein n=1 Tax=Haladaptatus sp. T7 TaxID=2029368 RepID=UPI0021A25834|nr:hypothetical protein [Haladaptatus sp. T7]GKZ12920.1 hypothetical protein HAL_08010 [Haladaptatus sp. T7]
MKGTNRTKAVVTVFVLSSVVIAAAFAGSAFGLQANRETTTSASPDGPATLDDSPAAEEFTCDSGENATMPGNCDVYLTVVPLGVDKEDDLAAFTIRNDGSGDSVADLTIRYETSQGESGTFDGNYLETNTTDDGSVTVSVYYDGNLVSEVQSDTDATMDLGQPNDSGDDNADDGTDGTDTSDGDERKDC